MNPEYKGWVYAHGSSIGAWHVSQQIECQDHSEVRRYKDYLIAVVADGAGSAANSATGAKFVTAHLASKLEDDLKDDRLLNDGLVPSDELWTSYSKEVFNECAISLRHYSEENSMAYESMACTAIAAIACQDFLLVAHIGDGRAAYCNQSDEWKAMIVPFKGELANETVFITSNLWDLPTVDLYFESNVIEDKIKSFCLLTDGCEKASFQCNVFDQDKQKYLDPNIPFKEFFHRNINVHLPMLYRSGTNQEEINRLWVEFLSNGNTNLKNEPDDKTMVLAVYII